MRSSFIDENKFEFTAFKIIVSLVAIFFAGMIAAAPIQSEYKTSYQPRLNNDLKSCSVPYAKEFCADRLSAKCSTENYWSRMLSLDSKLVGAAQAPCPTPLGPRRPSGES